MCCLNGYYGQIQNVRILKEPFRVSILPLTTLTPDQNLTVTASCDSWAANKYPDLIISLNRYCQVLDSKVKEGFRGHLVLVNCLSIQRDLVPECPLPPTYGIVFYTVNLHLPLYHLHPQALILSSVWYDRQLTCLKTAYVFEDSLSSLSSFSRKNSPTSSLSWLKKFFRHLVWIDTFCFLNVLNNYFPCCPLSISVDNKGDCK